MAEPPLPLLSNEISRPERRGDLRERPRAQAPATGVRGAIDGGWATY
jgi:hypothetical protein